MEFKYKEFLENLLKKYQLIDGKEKNYFVDGNNKIIGTLSKDLKSLVLYYQCDSEVIWNHNDIVAVTFAENFTIAKGKDVKNADVIYIEGLCGSPNDIRVFSNCYFELFQNLELCNLLENGFSINCIGYVTSDNVEFMLTSDDMIIEFNPRKDYRYGDEVEMLILNIHGDAEINYNSLYKFLRTENEWYYTTGYDNVGSETMRNFVESRNDKTYEFATYPKVKKI